MDTQTAIDTELHRMAQDCPEGLTDEELMRVLCASGRSQGDSLGEAMFSELFRRYNVRVTLWCFRFTRDRARALDMAQESFFRAYRHRHSFRGDSRFSTWLYAITRNQCLSSIRRAADPADGGELLPSRMRDLSATPADVALERKQRHREILQVMDAALRPTEARVMALHFGYELPLAEITQQLALTNKSGAKAYVISARRKLDRVIKRRNAAAKASPISRSAA